jgi:hypothetical protein
MQRWPEISVAAATICAFAKRSSVWPVIANHRSEDTYQKEALCRTVTRNLLFSGLGGGFLFAFFLPGGRDQADRSADRHVQRVCTERLHSHRQRCKPTLVMPQVEIYTGPRHDPGRRARCRRFSSDVPTRATKRQAIPQMLTGLESTVFKFHSF